MFLGYKIQIGQDVIILCYCGSYKAVGRLNDLYSIAPKEFHEECRKEQHQEHERQFAKTLSGLEKYKKIIIAEHPRLPFTFKGSEKEVIGKIKKMIPKRATVIVNIDSLRFTIGKEFEKPVLERNSKSLTDPVKSETTA